MFVSLAGGGEKIKVGQPLKLLLRFKNISANETFHVERDRGRTEILDYSYLIDFPSGKRVRSEMLGPKISSDMGSNIGPNETFECEIELSKICQLDEVGTYKIILQRGVWGPLEKRKENGNVVEVPSFMIVSSPLFVQVGDAGGLRMPEPLAEFKSVEADGAGIALTFKDDGIRFNYSIGGSDRTVSDYGETVKIPYGRKATFNSKELSLTFKPVSTNHIFSVERKVDLKNFGKNTITEQFAIQVTNGNKISYSPAINDTPDK